MTTVQQALTQLQTDVGQLQTDLNKLTLRRSTDPMQAVVGSLHVDMTAVAADTTSLANAIAAVPAPAPIPTPIPPVFLTPGGNSWTATNGDTWQIDSGLNILRNGSSANASSWQTHLGMGLNGVFYMWGFDSKVYNWNGGWQLVPYVAATNPVPAPAPPPPGTLVAFYISPTGNDTTGDGSRGNPWQTLEKAQAAMQGSKTKTTVLMAGTYHRTSTFVLGSADNGTTWQYDPQATATSVAGQPGIIGYGSAILDGGGTVGPFIIIGGSNITINGLQAQNGSNSDGIHVRGAQTNGTGFNAQNNVIKNCVIHDIPNVDGQPIGSWGSPNNQFLNNYIYNTGSKGIGVSATATGQDISGNIIKNNVLLNVVTTNTDNGAIYIQDLGNPVPGTPSTGIVVQNNFIRDYGSFANQTKGIYFDDGASNGTISGNVIAGAGNNAIVYHGGTNLNYTNNIIDLGPNGNQYIGLYQDSTASFTYNNMGGNTFQSNLVISTGAGTPPGWADINAGNVKPADSNNDYFNFTGGPITTSAGGISDSNPQNVNPQLSGWTYTIAAGSPVLSAPVNFTPLAGGWGPPGFVMPQTGTAPSSPH